MLKLVDWLEFMACADRFGNFRQKYSGALIFSSAGTLNRWKSKFWLAVHLACIVVRVKGLQCGKSRRLLLLFIINIIIKAGGLIILLLSPELSSSITKNRANIDNK